MTEVGARPIVAGVARGILVRSHARALVHTFRPQTWVVLQDLAFDAQWTDDRWVAPSSARLVAEHLRIEPGTAAAALRQLRDRGVAELTQAPGSAGRFGLASYTLQLPPGVEITWPCVGSPDTVAAHTAEPDTDVADAASPLVSTRRTGGRGRAASRSWTQDALDLGTGES